ncbi:MAG: methionine--tRNA ligase [Patescibacteria group bacterium]|nr:methionine--tRNA ligase [Patescibacteria group bacterium]
MRKKFYLTTAIPYVNAKPHIGFALELVQTDALARFHRLNDDDVYFLTGTDENSLKNVLAAEKDGIEVKKFVDRNTQKYIDLTKELNLTNDGFIRTTDRDHILGSQKLWLASKPDDIYKKKYKGLYCIGCEQFYTEKELVDGKCPEHLTVPETVEEENYFFKLSNYQKKLEQLLESDQYQIVPESRKNEMLSFIRQGLEDFSISRSQKRARGWGVPVPNDPDQVMYVWYDALSNYVTALGYAKNSVKFKKYWPANVHVIGKGITRFHAIYWPAMLLSAGLPLPEKLFVHGYINIAGAKMSKSLGNVVDPFEIVNKYGDEVTRYYLLRYMTPFGDSDFSFEQLDQAYQSDLANGLGNVVSRVTGLIEQNNITIEYKKLSLDKKYSELMNTFRIDQAIKYVWEKLAVVDSLISETKPWELAKLGKKNELTKILNTAANEIVASAYLLTPFMPKTAQLIEEIFSADKIKKSAAIFPRLN